MRHYASRFTLLLSGNFFTGISKWVEVSQIARRRPSRNWCRATPNDVYIALGHRRSWLRTLYDRAIVSTISRYLCRLLSTATSSHTQTAVKCGSCYSITQVTLMWTWESDLRVPIRFSILTRLQQPNKLIIYGKQIN